MKYKEDKRMVVCRKKINSTLDRKKILLVEHVR